MSKSIYKKIVTVLLMFTLIFSSFGAITQNVSANTSGNNIYAQFFVSPSGSDDNEGTYERPFLTIEKAQQAVRLINQAMTGDIYVFVEEGDYYIPEGMNFNEADSGFNGHRVHYKSLGAPGSAHLIGGVPITDITTDWEQTSAADADTTDYLKYLPGSAVGKVYKVKLDPEEYNFNQLYIGTKADTSFNKAIMARTPNKEEDAKFQAWNGPYFLSTKGSNKDMGYQSSDLTPAQIDALVKAQAAKLAEIAQLFVFDCGGYAFESNTLPINRIDKANNMIYSPFDSAHPEMYITKYNINANARYFMQGNISFLDTAGEYHYDKKTGWLYYYPTAADGVTSAQDMNNLNIIVPTTKEIIRLQGSDKPNIADWGKAPDLAKQVSHITFDGFTLEATESDNYIVDGWSYGETWYAGGTAIPYPPAEAAGSTQPYYSDYAVRPAYMHGGFTLINTNNITIQNSRITNMGLFGIVVWRDNSHNTFQNLVIENTGMGGINTDGGYPGVGKYNNNHMFYNLSIHNVGQVNAFGAGLQVMNTGHSTFKNLEIYYAPRRAISFVSQAQTMPEASPNFDPVRDVYNYGNRFEYIYVHDAEQDTAEDSGIFIGALFKGGDVQRIHGTRIPAEAINKETGQPYGELKAGNVFNQIVTSDIGSAPDVRDPNTVHGMDLAMGATGTYLSNIEGINNQSANLRVEPTQNGDVFYVDNVNSDYPTSAYNPRLYYSFDNSKMEYDRIGINRQYFPFTSELYNPNSPKLRSDSYFSDDFEGGEIDTTKWSIEKGNPVISTAYTAEGPFNGHYSLFINGGAKGNSNGVAVSRTFDDNLNKTVTGWFFDKRRDYAGNDYNEGLNDSDVRGQSYMRVDDNTSANHVGLGINGHASRDYFTYLDGTTEKLTTIPRSFGWHQFKFDYSTAGKVTLYINDQEVTTLDRASFNYIGMGNYDSTGAPGKNTGMSYYDVIDVYGGVDADPVEPLQPGTGSVPPYTPPVIVDPVTLIENWDFENGMPKTEIAITGNGQSATFNKDGFTTFWGTNPNLKVIANPKTDETNGSAKVMIVNNEPALYYEEAPAHEWRNYTLDLKFALDSDYTSTAQPLRFFVNTQPIAKSGTHSGKMTYQPAGYNVAFNKATNKMELYRADLTSEATNTHTLIEGSTSAVLPANLFKAVKAGGSWHTLSITVVDGTVSATLDETITISGQDSTYTSGYFAFVPYDGNTAKFNLAVDDISVKTNSSAPNMVYDANLKFGNATLNGNFNPSHTSYQASITDPTKEVTLIMPTSEYGATFAISLNGTDITSEFVDMTAHSLPLIFGSNTLTIAQTTAVGAKINYTVGIYKSYTNATIDTVSPVSTRVGTSPTLPKTVNVTFDGSNTQPIAVKWDMMNNTDLNTPGTYTVNGSLVGMYSKVSITVYINGVTSIDSLAPISILNTELPVLPTSVSAQTMEDGVLGSTTLSITFVEVDPSAYTKVGTVVLVAHVNGRTDTLLQQIIVSDAAESQVDTAALEAAITEAQAKVEVAEAGTEPGQYPQEAIDALTAAIDAATLVKENTSATQAEVDAAALALEDAVATFKATKNPTPGIDSTALEAAITKAQAKVEVAEAGTEPGQYPQEAIDTLTAAIDAATAVKDNTSATQAEVDAAELALNDAIATFEAAKVPTPAVDTTAPIWPDAQLTASNVGKNSLTLNWKAATDDFGVIAGYKLYKNGTELATLDSNVTSYQVTGLAADTTYSFNVEAVDGSNNWSVNGPTLAVKTVASSSGGGPSPTPTPTPTPEPVELKDITTHWAKTSIERAVELGFVKGYADETFKPDRIVNRGEFAAMLARALKLEEDSNNEITFADQLEIPAWAKPFIQSTAQAGIIKGYEDGTFRANNEISRSELAVMIVRALDLKVNPTAKLEFKDAEQVQAWAIPYVAAAAEAGLIKGYTDGRFKPAASATRAEAITLILAMLNNK